MRTTLLTAAALLLAVPAFADDMECSTPKMWQDAFNKGDANSVAGLYTPDAVEVSPGGVISGQEAIKARVAQGIKNDGPDSLKITSQKCVVDGPIRWSVGQWQNVTANPASGCWTLIETKSSGTFKIKNLTYSLTPPPPK